MLFQHRAAFVLAGLALVLVSLAASGAGVHPSTALAPAPSVPLPALPLPSSSPVPEGTPPTAPTVPAADAEVGAWRTRLLALHAATAPPSSREKPVLSARARHRQRLAERLQMPGASVDDVCVRRAGPYCAARSLDSFFDALDALSTEHDALPPGEAVTATPARHVRVAALGNSLIASDHITDIVRERLVERFGDGGRGFVLADRMAPYGRRTRTAAWSKGLVPFHIALADRGPHPYGIAGVLHVAEERAVSRFTVDGAERIRLFWWDHAYAPALVLSVDGKNARSLEPERVGRARIDTETLPAGTDRVDVVTGRGAVLYGASLERATPGVILDTLGVPASDAGLFLTIDDVIAREQLHALDPSLIVFVLGGNEIKRLAWGRKTLEETENEMRALFARLHDDAPQASCLVIGPLENVAGGEADEPFALRRQTLIINDAYRRASLAHGCAYFDTFTAMGGRGALKRLEKMELLHDDLVHPRGPALDAIGELVVTALLEHYDARPSADVRAAATLRVSDVVNGIEALPLPNAAGPLAAIDVFVAPIGGETRAFADTLGDALGVPVARHALPVRPVGLVLDIERLPSTTVHLGPASPSTMMGPLGTGPMTTSSATDPALEREVLRVVDGVSGRVLARAPLAAVLSARTELAFDDPRPRHDEKTEGAPPSVSPRVRALVDAAQVLIAAVMQARRVETTGLGPQTSLRPLVLAGDPN